MGNLNEDMNSINSLSSLISLRNAGPIGRPIGAERQRLGPSPLGAGMGPQARKVDPFGVWDLPPSYSGDMSSNFSLLPPSLSGQTLQSALDNLSKGSFSDLQYNGVGGGPGHGAMEPGPGGLGPGQTPAQQGFGLSPSMTPSKVDYSDWGTGSTGSGSAPASAQKPGANAGDPAQVRRNMNQMWPKEWGDSS